MKVLLPASIELNFASTPGLESVNFVTYDERVPVPDEHTDAEVLVVWANSPAQLVDCANRLTRLRWIQALPAGPDSVVAAGFPQHVVITSGRSLHDGPVAEHTLALALAAARRLDLMHDAQRAGRWARELGGSQTRMPSAFPGLGTLNGARVTIWGFGSIGQHLAPLLTMLGADVVGVARSAGERAGIQVITEQDLHDRLAVTDLLIGILPSTPATTRVLDAAVFDALPAHAWVINVGRGSTLDEEALDLSLRGGTLGGAALDVFEQEPLPAESPLWTTPNLIITPHAAGGRPVGGEALISKNLAAFRTGEPLVNVVER